jgi:hypothetical protein
MQQCFSYRMHLKNALENAQKYAAAWKRHLNNQIASLEEARKGNSSRHRYLTNGPQQTFGSSVSSFLLLTLESDCARPLIISLTEHKKMSGNEEFKS